ncbi:MAG: PAS domain-containing protein [Variibacter sp.]|nr:PAS domain-containing protein [Variibacter sp.]
MRRDPERGDEPGAPALWARLRPARSVIGASLLALALLAAFGALHPLLAAAAAAFVLAVALWGALARPDAAPATPAERRDDAGGAALRPLDDEAIRAVIAGLPDPVIVLDREARVIAFNPPARAVAPALRLGEHALLALRMPAVVEAVRRALALGEPQRAEFSERVPVDRWYEAHVVPSAPVAGHPRGLVLLTLRDLTPLRRVEEMRADFVANASHELRTPLAALSGFIDTLQGPARDDTKARERFLAIMKEQARRMARLIDDLLSLSRIELNAHIRPEQPVDLAPLLRQVVDGLQALAQERQVEVTVTVTEPSTVPGDRDELIRVFENLVENALKYGASGKRVDIVLARAEGPAGQSEARVSVRDYGPGIAAEHLPRLTERFYRVDVGQSRAEGGTGLGLALVKHILNRHRGRLLIESAPGRGATFTVCLPRVAAPLSD